MKALDKAKLSREIERERRKVFRDRLRALRDEIKTARQERRAKVLQIRLDCRSARERLRTQCALRKQRAREEAAQEIEARRRELAEQDRSEKQIRQADRRHAKMTARRSTSVERRQESDDEVRSNVPKGLVIVFNKVRKFIKGGPRKTRTEAFVEWVEENPSEVYAIQEADSQAHLSKLIAEHERLERLSRRASLAGVPF